MNFENAKKYILNKIERETRPEFFYHNLNHTLDVFHSSIRIAENENIAGHELEIIKLASLYHDSGMLRTYENHEEASADIVREVLPRFGYGPDDIETICRIIMTTQLPQSASNLLEKVICDADLDYLGRNDFFMISQHLRLEWYLLSYQETTLKEWYKLQVNFLTEHQYYTPTSLATRNQTKLMNLSQIEELLNHN